MTNAVQSTPDSGLRIRTEVKAQNAADVEQREPEIIVKDVNLSYGENHVLHNISMEMEDRRVTALIGPSGCGKSTLLRCLNRMNDLIDDVRITGTIRVKGIDINAPATDVIDVRRVAAGHLPAFAHDLLVGRRHHQHGGHAEPVRHFEIARQVLEHGGA